jgi:hypothetical protein
MGVRSVLAEVQNYFTYAKKSLPSCALDESILSNAHMY